MQLTIYVIPVPRLRFIFVVVVVVVVVPPTCLPADSLFFFVTTGCTWPGVQSPFDICISVEDCGNGFMWDQQHKSSNRYHNTITITSTRTTISTFEQSIARFNSKWLFSCSATVPSLCAEYTPHNRIDQAPPAAGPTTAAAASPS